MKQTSFILLILALTLTSCASWNNLTKGTLIGTTAGAAVGAAAGAYFGDTTKGAIIGAAVGGATGAIIGRNMDKQAEELAKMEAAKVERIGEGIAISFESGLLFATNSAELQSAARENLTTLATSLKNFPDSDVLVVGHTDSTGTAALNQTLSERRAASAKAFLMAQGIAEARIKSEGRGLNEPIADNATAESRDANRRIEVAIFANEEYVKRMQAQN
jgi:outer membrane protein OmpA-like peptidoglycan-associated protein